MAFALSTAFLAVPIARETTTSLQQLDRVNPPVGWELVENGNMPLGRGTAGMCTGPWGVMVFGGELTEHMWTSQTLLLPSLGGDWQVLYYPAGEYPAARANPGMARFEDGCLLFGGVGDPSVGYTNYGDTWFWTLEHGWTQLSLTVSPPPRFYHTLTPMSNGDLIMYGGRTQLYAAADSCAGDVWVYSASITTETKGRGVQVGGWMNITVRGPTFNSNVDVDGGRTMTHLPAPRWGHGMTCALKDTGPPIMRQGGLPPSKIECLMFGGSQMADNDYFDDTWLLRIGVNETTGAEIVPRSYYWEAMNSPAKPHGRWCFSMATCGSRVVMVGGSTDYRVSADETWVWDPFIRPVEDPTHPPGHTGHWERYYGVDPMAPIPEPRPSTAGPLHISGFAISNVGEIGASDIVLFGGVNNQTGGLFLHKGWETAQMWRWPCTRDSWPEAMIASPPTPPSSPPPPSLSPLERPLDWAGGTIGYVPTPTDPTGSRDATAPPPPPEPK